MILNTIILEEEHLLDHLFFYAVKNMTGDKNTGPNPIERKKWTQFYTDFEKTFEAQNNVSWPKLNYIDNGYRKRLEIFTPSSYYPSKNILILLSRLVYIENYKTQHIHNRKDYHKILTHKIDIPDKYISTKVTFIRLFEILKMYMNYYLRIYQNGMMYENILAKLILDQM